MSLVYCSSYALTFLLPDALWHLGHLDRHVAGVQDPLVDLGELTHLQVGQVAHGLTLQHLGRLNVAHVFPLSPASTWVVGGSCCASAKLVQAQSVSSS